VRIVIADDNVLLREGIAQLLSREGFEVTAAVGTAEELVAAVGADTPDLAVVDIRMPPTHTDEGLRAATALREAHPRLGILLLSQWVHAGRALDLFRAGGSALGYLLKDRVTDVDDFIDAIHRVARGGCVLDPDVVTALIPPPARWRRSPNASGRSSASWQRDAVTPRSQDGSSSAARPSRPTSTRSSPSSASSPQPTTTAACSPSSPGYGHVSSPPAKRD
jgi:DNA-binding NarL/FixJ family response regulator